MARGLDGFIEQRAQDLYISPDYKVFLLTGQKEDHSWRHAYISVYPFNILNEEEMSLLSAEAKPLDTASRIKIDHTASDLQIYDLCTGTTSLFPLNELDEDIKTRLLPRRVPSAKRPTFHT